MSLARLALLVAACLLLPACEGGVRMPWAPPPPPLVQFDDLAANPGVYAGREIAVTGALYVQDGQACLTDRGRRIAVRLTAQQAALYQGIQNWPVTAEGVFRQNLCPSGRICTDYCAAAGLDAPARLLDPGAR